MRGMELLQNLLVHCRGDHQTAPIHNVAIVKGEVVADVPVSPTLFLELVSMLWKTVNDVMLKLLAFLVILGMLVQIL